jgi:hypothetical protein
MSACRSPDFTASPGGLHFGEDNMKKTNEVPRPAYPTAMEVQTSMLLRNYVDLLMVAFVDQNAWANDDLRKVVFKALESTYGLGVIVGSASRVATPPDKIPQQNEVDDAPE